jgi:hypothetical protein
VRSLVATQVSNGWTDATTLYDYHFDPETQQLTDAGAHQLRIILEDAPSLHRRAFVQTSFTAGANETRMASVQEIASRLTGGMSNLPVELRNTTPAGRPAREIDSLNRRIMETAPSPRIKYGQSSGYGLTQGR